MATTVDWALLYAQAGWRSFPVKPGGKTPVYKNWQADATVDPNLIGRYFAPEDRNIGLVCGEAFDAWDIEVAHITAFAEFEHRNGGLPPAPVASTGRGGVHILTAPTGVDGTRYLYLDGKHIGELKSRGGFIVAAPSETEDQYVWTSLPPRLAVPEAPHWLRGLLERPEKLRKTLPTRIASPEDAAAVLGQLTASVLRAGEGKRNNYLYWAVRRAIEEGIPGEKAIRVFEAAGLEAGLEADEVEKTVHSALDAESIAA